MTKAHGFIGAEQLARVKSAISLPDLVGEVVKLRKDGKGFAGLCPWHQERTPSFGLFEKDAGWQFYCHGCHAKGSAIDWVMKREGIEFQEAVEALADRAGIRLVYEKGHQRTEQVGPKKSDLKAACAAAAAWFAAQLAEEYGADALDYLANRRRLTEETIAAWQLGWAPGNGQCCAHLMAQGFGEEAIVAAGLGRRDDRGLRDVFWRRVMIPIRDQVGAVVAFAGRILPVDDVARADGSKPPKYINTSETSIYHKGDLLFGLHAARAAIQADESATLVEGQLDVICAHQLGLRTAVACCGTAFTPAHADRLRPLIGATGRLVLLLDGDAAGAKATAAAISTAWQSGMGVVVGSLAVESAKDLGDVVAHGAQLVLGTQVASDQWLIKHLIPRPAADALDRLPQADAVLDQVVGHPDGQWREMVVERLAETLDLSIPKMRARLKARVVKEPAPEKAPGSAAAGAGGDEGQVMDGGVHAAIIAKLVGFLIEEQIAPDAVGGWLRAGTDHRIAVKGKALVDRFCYRYAPRFQALHPDRVRWMLAAMVHDQRQVRRAEILKPITGIAASKEGLAELRRWVIAVTGKDDATDLAVIVHFLWQVKRRSSDLSVSHDLMPILVGRQGDGKSVGVKYLCAPLRELTRPVNAEALTDDRHKEGLAEYHIGIWDELAGGSKADVQALKSVITADVVSYRELSTHTINILPKRITLIATSNDDVSDIITDTTGARRFYQLVSRGRHDIEVGPDAGRDSWTVISHLDYELLWAAVHQEDPPPFDGASGVIRDRQATLVHTDNVMLWLQGEQFDEVTVVESDRPFGSIDSPANHIIIPRLVQGGRELCDHTYRRYSRWCRQTGSPQMPANKLGARLRSLGLQRVRPSEAPRPWCYEMPDPLPESWAIAGRFAASAPRQAKTTDQHDQDGAAAFQVEPTPPRVPGFNPNEPF